MVKKSLVHMYVSTACIIIIKLCLNHDNIPLLLHIFISVFPTLSIHTNTTERSVRTHAHSLTVCGQPKMEKGSRPEEYQVSSTSSSVRSNPIISCNTACGAQSEHVYIIIHVHSLVPRDHSQLLNLHCTREKPGRQWHLIIPTSRSSAFEIIAGSFLTCLLISLYC